MTDINPYGSDGGRVAQPETDRVRVVVYKVIEVDCSINIPAVVKKYSAECLHKAQREPQLRIQNE